MSPQVRSLLDAALALPEAERIELADCLYDSIPSETLEEQHLADDELYAELERRRADVEAGRVKPIPWEEFRWEE